MNTKMCYLFKIKIQGLAHRIELSEDELNGSFDLIKELFFSKVFGIFDIKNKEELFVKLIDRDGDSITDEDLPKLLRQYKNDSNFHVEVVFRCGVITSQTAQMLKIFLEKNQCNHLFTEYDNHGFLQKQSKKLLVQNVVTYLINTYSLHPKYEEVFDICSATIELFPVYKTHSSLIGGIDILYNKDLRSGDLYQVLIYRQRKYAHCDTVPISFNETDFDQEEVEKLVNFLSSCKLPADEKKLKEKLEQTIDLRKMLMSQQDDTYPKIFEFYLVDPQVILFDFQLMYPQAAPMQLIDLWKDVEKKPFELHKIKIDEEDPVFNSDLQLHNFLTYLKLINAHKVKFANAVKSFLVYSEEPTADPNRLQNRKNSFPHMIFIKANDEKKFYIDIHHHLISVPKDFSFVQALDLFYKVHKVFQVPFHSHVQQIMGFFGTFIYQVPGDERFMTAKTNSFKYILNGIQQ